MSKRRKSDGGDVPDALGPKVQAIQSLLEAFCTRQLNEEYRDVCLRMLAKLARKRPSPLINGTPASWAAGVVRAMGIPNFLHDKAQKPHATTSQIDSAFGVSQATGNAKSKFIRDLLKISPLSTEWVAARRLEDHPVTKVMGMFGATPAPRERKRMRPDDNEVVRLYTMETFILEGPLTDEFVKANPVIARTIQIRGDQTLAALHTAIFNAYDRFENHMYVFEFGNGMNDPGGAKYGPHPDGKTGDAATTTIEFLDLKVGRAFGYLFDFGDDWWHQINVLAVDDDCPAADYPKLIKAEGASPPQYADFEKEG